MKYVFIMEIYTDGDFTFPFIPNGMRHDYGDYDYHLEKIYKNKDDAVEDIMNICKFMKEQIDTHRDYVKEDWYRCVDEFVKELEEDGETAHSFMSGNYDGTRLFLGEQQEVIKISFAVNDDELELIKRNKPTVDIDTIKEAVLNLYRKD